MLQVNQDYCLGCGACVIVCPVNQEIYPEVIGGNGPDTTEVIMLVENGIIKLFHPEKCTRCMKCNDICPTKAIYYGDN
ncbi:ferredoxin family protein [Methanosphaera sp. WGK6]|uniref:4Fe-4S dicluster domain-containing protein n=1 Tax=Methanosphaera sp. WGK6 TaxID=1561964 RepID=UPI00084C31E0|nr:4Fe-4S binding protein [Methanosphaera sp. WGK6]OED30291.1 ferredoxin [Methanosphaera sp. WGK6]